MIFGKEFDVCVTAHHWYSNINSQQDAIIIILLLIISINGITKLDKEKNQCNRQKKNGSTEHIKGNKTVPEKVATTCTEDGHKETTKTSTTI